MINSQAPEEAIFAANPKSPDKETVLRRVSATLDAIEFEPLFDDISLKQVQPFKAESEADGVSVDFEQTYAKLRARSEAPREGITVGLGSFEGNKALTIAANWGVRGAATGEIEGAAIVEGFRFATERKLPVVLIGASAGMDQQQAANALLQMPRMAAAMSLHREITNQPYISIMAGPTYGGTSASIAMEGHFNVAVNPGTPTAFTGPEIVKHVANNILHDPSAAVKPIDQSAIFNMMNGNGVDGIIKEEEIVPVVGKLLSILSGEKEEHGKHNITSRIREKITDIMPRQLAIKPREYSKQYPGVVTGPSQLRSLNEAIYHHTPVRHSKGEKGRFIIPAKSKTEVPEDPAQRWAQNFESHIKTGELTHIDTMTILQYGFDDFVLMRNPYEHRGRLCFDSIVTAYASVDGQPVVIIGQQPDFEIGNDQQLLRRYAEPGPKDWRRATEAVQRANWLDIPIITLLDSPGAKSDRWADRDGQSKAMSETLVAVNSSKVPALTYVIGAAGSGGAICGLSLFPKPQALETANIVVASPLASALILKGAQRIEKTGPPSLQLVQSMLDAMRSGAEAWHGENSIFRGIIKTDPNPLKTTEHLMQAIREDLATYGRYTPEQLRQGRLGALAATSSNVEITYRAK